MKTYLKYIGYGLLIALINAYPTIKLDGHPFLSIQSAISLVIFIGSIYLCMYIDEKLFSNHKEDKY